ncbi:unnamed protein product [Caenorhabditis sp. 36 PRJEB53466]|nr:unnamed protein product [Caenorhabditis sp. 36 PRJEB53466]
MRAVSMCLLLLCTVLLLVTSERSRALCVRTLQQHFANVCAENCQPAIDVAIDACFTRQTDESVLTNSCLC